VVVGATGVIAVRRHHQPRYRLLGGILVLSAVVATVVGASQWLHLPDGAGGDPLPLLMPIVALIGSLVATFAPDTARGARLRLVGLLAASVALGWWAWARFAVLSHAVVPSEVPVLDRVATAAGLGLALGVAALTVWQPPRPRRT